MFFTVMDLIEGSCYSSTFEVIFEIEMEGAVPFIDDVSLMTRVTASGSSTGGTKGS
jgi:hypothetical protein